jgi:hypothetical protein
VGGVGKGLVTRCHPVDQRPIGIAPPHVGQLAVSASIWPHRHHGPYGHQPVAVIGAKDFPLVRGQRRRAAPDMIG